MKSAILLLANYVSLLCFLACFLQETSSCDTKWIRFVYMMSCGKKKRESVSTHNVTSSETLPGDFEGALRYFRARDPFNPMLTNEAFLYRLLQEDEASFRLHPQIPKFLGSQGTTQSSTTPTSTTRKSSILIDKLLVKVKTGNFLGIPGFPEHWDIEEIIDEKINENHRREIDRLIEECCKVPPVTTCNENTFLGACK